MNDFQKNILSLYGEAGDEWINSLPDIENKLAQYWGLSDICPVSNMTYNYVAKAQQSSGQHVVLKICCEKKLFQAEVEVLQYFAGYGMVQLLLQHADYHAMLLHQAVPGKSLRDDYPDNIERVIDAYSTVISQFKTRGLARHLKIQHVTDWLSALDHADHVKISSVLLNRAIALRNDLLASSKEEYVLHGDLHHDNILSDNDSWVAIDPKGVIGEIAFEAACFDFIHSSEFTREDVPVLFEERARKLSAKLGVDLQRLKDWVFIRLILGACWMAEDNGDPSRFLMLAKKIFSVKDGINE